MNHQDFLRQQIEKAVKDRPDSWRKGQAAFNALYSLAPGWADSIRGGKLDPFHRDDRLPEFYAFVDSITIPPKVEEGLDEN